MNKIIESEYPLTFREDEVRQLGEHIRHHNSVVLVGMKRVGISNFLRFFLHHEQVVPTYIKAQEPIIFITVDFNDLVEREAYPFWVLLLKRLVDAVDRSDTADVVKKASRQLFTESIQLKDLFFTMDSVQKVLDQLVNAGVYPVIFLIRFDRLKDAITQEFYANLQRLKDAAKHRLSYVITSYRPLYELAPEVFTKASLATFAKDMYLTPVKKEDLSIILSTLEQRYEEQIAPQIKELMLIAAAGHVQYLHLSVIKYHEEKIKPQTKEALVTLLQQSEEVLLLSEEIYSSLTSAEQEMLLKVHHGESISAEQREKAHYLWHSGMITQDNHIFSELFAHYLTKISGQKPNGGEFTKKEHLLLKYLQSREGELCERDEIINAVWPEQAEMGVSDWAIDRLISRVRAKLKAQNSPFEVVTVITRGYKLIRKT